MESFDTAHASSNPGAQSTASATAMGRVLTFKPGDTEWSWSDYPLTRGQAVFAHKSVQAMVGGVLDERLILNRKFGLIVDDKGLEKKLPYCISLRMRGFWQPFFGPVALARFAEQEMVPEMPGNSGYLGFGTMARHYRSPTQEEMSRGKHLDGGDLVNYVQELTQPGMAPLRERDRDYLLTHFKWKVA